MNCSNPKRRRILRWAVIGGTLSLAVVTLGFVAVVYGWTQFARTPASLQGWHLQRPLSEFVAWEWREGYVWEADRNQGDQVDEIQRGEARQRVHEPPERGVDVEFHDPP